MEKEEFQKKYNNSILVCCTEASIKKVLNICYLMDLTASKSKQITDILIGEQTAKSPLFHVEQFFNDFYRVKEEEGKNQPKEPKFEKGNRIMYAIKDSNGNLHAVTRVWNRLYESREHNTLFIVDEEGTVTDIRKEK